MIEHLFLAADDIPDIPVPEYKGQPNLIRDVFAGKVGPRNPPASLFDFTFMALVKLLAEQFGLPADFDRGSERRRMALKAKNSLGIFSGAKTFQNVLELSLAVKDANGEIRNFGEFAKIAQDINSRYNLSWLQAEQQAAFRQTRAIETWQKIQDQADIFPLLQYSTVNDDRVRPDHAEQDGKTYPVDHPFWDTWYPPNGWRCRCLVRQMRDGNVSEGEFETNDDTIFGQNVGRSGVIFPDRHPYNEIPSKYKKQSERNFGFSVPTDQDIRKFLDK